jgi:sugar phosphate isomerase/epimerase
MPPQMRIRIGAHIWAYAARQPNYDVYPILNRIFQDFSSAGLEGIELMENSLLHSDSYEKVSALSKKYNVPVMGSSFGADMYIRSQHEHIMGDAQRVISILAKLNARDLGISTGGKDGSVKTPAELDIQAEILTKIKRMCEDNGLIMNLHNHTYEVENNEYELKENIKRIPDIRLGPDLNWLLRAGIDPFGFLRRYGDRISYMHVRDESRGRWVEALGEGDFDLFGFREVLQEIKFEGDIGIELAHEEGHKFVRSMGDDFKLSYQNLKKALQL